jgi:hypothetical protein
MSANTFFYDDANYPSPVTNAVKLPFVAKPETFARCLLAHCLAVSMSKSESYMLRKEKLLGTHAVRRPHSPEAHWINE